MKRASSPFLIWGTDATEWGCCQSWLSDLSNLCPTRGLQLFKRARFLCHTMAKMVADRDRSA
jgi:hypothetical protein